MKAKYLLLVSLFITIVSCQKNPSIPHDTPAVATVVKLRNMNVLRLPSPYYHFEYNDSGYIIQVNFSSGLNVYDVSYAGKNILKMENIIGANRDTLQYEYSNGDPVVIKVKNKNGMLYRRCFLAYTNSRQLEQIDWDVKDGNDDFALEQTLQFSYYPDGNLKDLVTHFYPVGPQTESTYTDRFENYDNKVNADGFALLHTVPHHLILLPGFKLQLNNPGRNIRTGDGNNYEVNYTYTYDSAGRPLVKKGDFLYTKGTDSGKHFDLQTTFSYF